ncbi:hypothetical protein SCHPADRAFT_203062 [Schizopora paradoxa]|uniref:Uncharacterized protein n=1 Tax=Schizopora paradoxa TaxID=27342 RepID=A0A0H2S4S9_9AGAM|nr:hypothetical protein SCHPADRAFT_203062 [Schizopora paradoxa]
MPVFGRGRRECPFDLLAAAFRAEVEVLLPVLYFACSDFAIESILKVASTLPMECFFTLLRGREASIDRLSKFAADLPERLTDEIDEDICQKDEPCLKNAYYKDVSELINADFESYSGEHIVNAYLSRVCPHCNCFVVNEIERRRRDIWAEVPRFFGCPSWGILEEKFREITGSR